MFCIVTLQIFIAQQGVIRKIVILERANFSSKTLVTFISMSSLAPGVVGSLLLIILIYW